MPKPLTWLKNRASEANLADWCMVFFTLIIAAATIAYTVYARRQWQAMSGQLTTMNKQWTEMQHQTTLTRDQLEGTMAAVLKVNTNVNLDGKTFQFNLMNVGHVVARNVTANLKITKRALPTERLVGVPISVNFTMPEIGLTQDMWQQREYPLHMSDAEKALILDTKLTLRIEGTLTYNNGFEVIPQDICFAYLTYRLKDKTGRWVGTGNNPQVPCDEFDIELRGILEQKREMLKTIFGQQQHPN